VTPLDKEAASGLAACNPQEERPPEVGPRKIAKRVYEYEAVIEKGTHQNVVGKRLDYICYTGVTAVTGRRGG